MSQEPAFPADAFGKRAPTAPAPAPAAPAPSTPKGNVEPSGREASALDSAAAPNSYASRLWPAGVAIGIGSAAIAAALLYRSRK